MQNDSARKRSMSASQLKDITSALVQSIPTEISFEKAQFMIRNKKSLVRHVQKGFGIEDVLPGPLKNALIEAETFTRKAFGINVNLSEMFIVPEHIRDTKSLLAVFIPSGMSTYQYLDAVSKVVKIGSYEHVYNDLGSSRNRLYFLKRSEEPREYMDRSANSLKGVQLSGFEWVSSSIYAVATGTYYLATGTHLDESETTTLFPNEKRDSMTLGAYWDKESGFVRFGLRESEESTPVWGARLATPAILL